MTAAPATKGWCPTLLSPMQSGDGWLARVKPSAGVLSSAVARLIAGAARRYGNGHIDLTSRGNLQIRGLTPRSAEDFAETIIGAGLASADPSLEAVRNVMASPLGPDDPTAPFDSHAVARDIEAMLAGEPALWALPPKFCILVDGGGALPLRDLTADIMVRAHEGALAVHLDGGIRAALCAPSSLAGTVKALALAFLRLSAQRSETPRRMRALVMAVGEEAIFAEAGLAAVHAAAQSKSQAGNSIGLISLQHQPLSGFGVGLPFGRVEADALTRLANLAERYGDGSLRTTPWRAPLLTGITAADADRLADEVSALGLIADPTDPRLTIFACVGAPSCASATVDARGDAARLAAAIGVTRDQTLHVSGCGKSCAHRGSASLTLVGRDGRYDLIRNGSAIGRPSLTGLSIDQIEALLLSAKGPRP
ncbi:precorrin-3B synthase [Methyloceanibacter sp.]|uniref:precorrin-3B synthase n=1 Tax=Methyloceanibacter sp. TaxID=1965321 RepID=UPI003D6D428E